MGKSFFVTNKISAVLEDIIVNRKSNVKMHLGASIMCNNFLKTAIEKKNQLKHENLKPYYPHFTV